MTLLVLAAPVAAPPWVAVAPASVVVAVENEFTYAVSVIVRGVIGSVGVLALYVGGKVTL